MVLLHLNSYSILKMNGNEMGAECSEHEGDEKFVQSLSRSMKEGDHSVNQRIDVRIVLKRSLEKLGWVVWTGFI
jgi:hypothetical protein